MTKYLSNLLTEHSRVSIAIAAGIGVATVWGLTYWYRKYIEEIPPKKWRKVGELVDLITYPIKSCGPVRLNAINCSQIGLEHGKLRDRIFMVITTNGEFVTGRQYPTLTQVHPQFEGNVMKLSAPGMMDVEVDIERLSTVPPIKCSVWGQPVEAIECGEEVARWFSRYILSEDFGLRLVYYRGEKPQREVREKNRIFDTMHSKDTGAFHDATSFLLFNESSVTDLNLRLSEPVQALNFRPNFVVKGPLPYEEDKWKWVKIGNEVIFRNVKPCTRCIFTTVNPETGTFSKDRNPLKALKEYRTFKKTGDTPVLGIHLGVRLAGTVTMGDSVYVEAD